MPRASHDGHPDTVRRLLGARRRAGAFMASIDRARDSVHELVEISEGPDVCAYYGADGAWVIDIDSSRMGDQHPDTADEDGVPYLIVTVDRRIINTHPRRRAPQPQPRAGAELRIDNGPMIVVSDTRDGTWLVAVDTIPIRRRDPAGQDRDGVAYLRVTINDHYIHEHNPAAPLPGSRDQLSVDL